MVMAMTGFFIIKPSPSSSSSPLEGEEIGEGNYESNRKIRRAQCSVLRI
jgi:hypothetical protein